MTGHNGAPWNPRIEGVLERARQTNRELTDDVGVDVTLYNDESGGYDPATGEIHFDSDRTGVTVSGEVSVPGGPIEYESAAGETIEIRVLVWVPDDISVDLHTVGEDDEHPTKLDVETIDRTMRVIEAADEDNGLIRLECE